MPLKSFTLSLLCCSILQISIAQSIKDRLLVYTDRKYDTCLVNNGADKDRFTLVFMGDGFRKDEQHIFNARVQAAIDTIRRTHPFDAFMKAFNIYRINIVSDDSGIAVPPYFYPKSPLCCSFGDVNLYEIPRCIRSRCVEKIDTVAELVKDCAAIIIIANDPNAGGCTSPVSKKIYVSLHPQSGEIIMHELGHRISERLADEYDYVEKVGDHHNIRFTSTTGILINVTNHFWRDSLPWADLVHAAVPPATMLDYPKGVIGAWEGAMYVGLGIYRPQFNCRMRELGTPFCKVCERELSSVLTYYLPSTQPSTKYLPMNTLRQEIWLQRFPILLRLPHPAYNDYSAIVSIVLQGLNKNYVVDMLDEHNHIIASTVEASKPDLIKISYQKVAGKRGRA